jgi:hypothetical protein
MPVRNPPNTPGPMSTRTRHTDSVTFSRRLHEKQLISGFSFMIDHRDASFF